MKGGEEKINKTILYTNKSHIKERLVLRSSSVDDNRHSNVVDDNVDDGCCGGGGSSGSGVVVDGGLCESQKNILKIDFSKRTNKSVRILTGRGQEFPSSPRSPPNGILNTSVHSKREFKSIGINKKPETREKEPKNEILSRTFFLFKIKNLIKIFTYVFIIFILIIKFQWWHVENIF
mgnify:FL=1